MGSTAQPDAFCGAGGDLDERIPDEIAFESPERVLPFVDDRLLTDYL